MRTLKTKILEQPGLFNVIRNIIAGNQEQTKNFVNTCLIKYKAKTVLDVGCGTGDFIVSVPENIDYLGADINRKYISYAVEHFENAKRKFILQDVTDPSFYKNKKFDAVLFISMLHHLSDDELKNILPIVKRMTNRVVIIADIIPDPEGFLKKFMVRLDQGKFIRSKQDKVTILEKYFNVVRTEIIQSRLAVQFGIICEV